jgi:hypothetical protein
MKKILMCIILTIILAGYVFGFSGSGSGTELDPYQTTTCTQLQEMRDDLSASYILMNNIDCSATSGWNWDGSKYLGFEPIGSDLENSWTVIFSGTFDGQNHTITGLYINRPDQDLASLFGYTNYASINNVGLVNVNINGGNYVGGLSGGSEYDNISNCYVTGKINGLEAVGGLFSYSYYGNIYDSYFSGNITGSHYVGGLGGAASESNIYNSYSIGNMNATNQNGYVGGLIGDSDHCNIYNSFSDGNVNSIGNYVGGLIGKIYYSKIFDSHLFHWKRKG